LAGGLVESLKNLVKDIGEKMMPQGFDMAHDIAQTQKAEPSIPPNLCSLQNCSRSRNERPRGFSPREKADAPREHTTSGRLDQVIRQSGNWSWFNDELANGYAKVNLRLAKFEAEKLGLGLFVPFFG
jgi:hypothetical protein